MNDSPIDITSGTVEINGDSVLWHNEDVVFLQFEISHVVVIGEYTNSNGPWFDDWYITFVLKNGQWKSIPQYAGNIEQLMEELSKRFDPIVKERQLANSTEWKSVVSYPKNIRGKQLFKLITVAKSAKPRNFFQRLLRYLGITNPDTSKDIVLSEEVQEVLNGYR